MTDDSDMSHEDFHEYWLDPEDQSERPDRFLGTFDRSRLLLELLEPHVSPDDHLLELGCGAGANLAYLYEQGYTNLSGIELNPESVELFEEHYPEAFSETNVEIGPVEEQLPEWESNSVTATIAVTVLAHVHPESEHVFDEIVRVTDDILVTIENEHSTYKIFEPRNYETVFSERGAVQLSSRDGQTVGERTDLSDNCWARVFAVGDADS